jgi:3-methyladenine DNA glycosylase AlkD
MNANQVVKEFEKRSEALTAEQLKAEARYSPTKLKVRRISKADYKFISKDFMIGIPEDQQAQIWIEVFNKSPYRNLDSIAIDFFKLRQKRKTFSLDVYADEIFKWISKVDCWMTGDMLASLTSQIHEANPKKYFPKLQKLTKAKSPWQNRMSLLSLYYYSSCRKVVPTFEQSIGFVQLHLKKDHYHLQKSVGWTLREMNNVHPKKTEQWIDRNLLELSPIAFSTATEKIKGKQKEMWKQRRKEERKKRT